MATARKSKSKSGSKKRAKPARKRSRSKTKASHGPFQPLRWVGFILLRSMTVIILTVVLLVVIFSVVNPPITHTIWSEQRRLGSVDRQWVPLEDVAPVMARSVVAAEDANFCLHWGFDVTAIRAAMAGGGARGGSTITQQVVKNVFLWQGRSWLRKVLEAAITPLVEVVWSKRRIIEVYLNIAELDEGVFGIEAAARQYFDKGPEDLSPHQAALIASVLPSPKTRSAARPSGRLRKRARSIEDGAATILADGRSVCFED